MDLMSLILSWNRKDLIKKTIESYKKETTVTHDLFVIDNGSNDDTVNCLKELKEKYYFTLFLLKENLGGMGLNHVLDKVDIRKYRFVHFSENDMEYLPNWDHIISSKLEAFPEVGQISLFSPFPRTELGEFSWTKRAVYEKNAKGAIYIAKGNVGSTSVVRSEIIENGLRWSNIETNHGFRFPNDGLFSRQIKNLGWQVAYNDNYVVRNWGHTLEEFAKDPIYYVNNHKRKSLRKLEKRLQELGYKLTQDERGDYKLTKHTKRKNRSS